MYSEKFVNLLRCLERLDDATRKVASASGVVCRDNPSLSSRISKSNATIREIIATVKEEIELEQAPE